MLLLYKSLHKNSTYGLILILLLLCIADSQEPDGDSTQATISSGKSDTVQEQDVTVSANHGSDFYDYTH